MWLKVCEKVRVSNSLDPDETGKSVTSRWQGSQPDDACLQAAWLFWLRSLSSTDVVSRKAMEVEMIIMSSASAFIQVKNKTVIANWLKLQN